MCELGKRAHVTGFVMVHVDIYENVKLFTLLTIYAW